MIFGRIHAANLLHKLDEVIDDLPAAAEKADEAIADAMADEARARAIGLGGVHRHVAGGIGTSRPGTIELDVNRQPAILGAEFGAIRYRQFPPWKGQGEGYMLHPELRDDDVVERYAEALDDELDL